MTKPPWLMLWDRCTGSICGKNCILKTTLKKTHQGLQRFKACTSLGCVYVRTTISVEKKIHLFDICFYNNELYLDMELHFYYLIHRFAL